MVYNALAPAVSDLKLFSQMHSYEDKVLALVKVPGGTEIMSKIPSLATCEAMALNGQIFLPAPN